MRVPAPAATVSFVGAGNDPDFAAGDVVDPAVQPQLAGFHGAGDEGVFLQVLELQPQLALTQPSALLYGPEQAAVASELAAIPGVRDFGARCVSTIASSLASDEATDQFIDKYNDMAKLFYRYSHTASKLNHRIAEKKESAA